MRQDRDELAKDGLAAGMEQDGVSGEHVEELDLALEQRLALENQLTGGANWFFWIAGLSIVNSVVILAEGGWAFFVGLGTTRVIDILALGLSKSVETPQVLLAVAFFMDVIVVSVVALFGVLARKRHSWAFIVGMLLYALDGLLFILMEDILSIGFHLFVLWGLYGGLRACRALRSDVPRPIMEGAAAG